jgi:hypothetical protein
MNAMLEIIIKPVVTNIIRVGLSLLLSCGMVFAQHVLVYRETGRLGGWPANHGIWSWGNEILVGFSAAWFKEQPNTRHQQDPSKPEEPRLARSLDGGKTWTIESPRDLLPPAQGGREPRDLTESMDFARPGFAMTLRFLDSNHGPSLFWFTYDKGKSWQGPFKFPQFGNGVLARTDYLIEGPREALVFLSQSKTNGREGRPLCARTRDGGVNWEFVSYIGPEPAGFAIMPSTVRLAAHKLLTTVRVHEQTSNYIDAYQSEDDARTWTRLGTVADTGEFGGNPPMLLKLLDGRLCLTYGYRAQPYGIRARLSRDGVNWGDVVTIRDGAPAWEVGYTRSVQRPDGKIVTVYYFNDGLHNERFIEAAIWDPPVSLDLTSSVVVVRDGALPPEATAARMFVEEVEKRTGIRLATTTHPANGQAQIVIETGATGGKADGYHAFLDPAASRLSGVGNDARGTLFAAGQLLRRIDWAKGRLSMEGPLDIRTAPAYPVRGHQLGYRTQANSYDAWSPAQFEQYIRELTWFGANSIEGIPLHDDRPSAVMKTPRREMNRAIGEVCQRYGLDYWAWIPADFDLKDTARRAQFLDRAKQFFTDTPTLTGVFFPGGDPGNNPPELVLPFLEDMGRLLMAAHPKARIWLSLQWFKGPQVDGIYKYIEERQPAWFAGVVGGPSSPPLDETRRRLPRRYMLRDYPDLTHNKLCQYPVPEWDQAYALTLGREAVNPRPAEFAAIHARTAGYTDGFISYSDGAHDDVNKTVWSALSWDPNMTVRDILMNYARAYFNPAVAETAADGILALERNWHGPLVDNGAVEGTLELWQALEKRAPELASNWRWQMCLLRANYDAYDRRRLIRESALEEKANRILLSEAASDEAMDRATAVLESAVTERTAPELRNRIIELCDRLFRSIGLQSSVAKYYASGEERGAVLDFIDYPLNNRWWIEDQFKLIRAMKPEKLQQEKLTEIAMWEHPGPGSFYDDIGNIAKSPHVVAAPSPTYWWWDEGMSRARLSWQTTAWPGSMAYEALDPNAKYVVRSRGYNQALLRINGESVNPTVDGKEMKEWRVDPKYYASGRLVLEWERPADESHLNWRERSRLAEVWLIKR